MDILAKSNDRSKKQKLQPLEGINKFKKANIKK